ncbi:hypothetical protein GMMP1_300005 [Candidatus Magnetomoraceae bacterium gMMP-1]
MKYFGIKQDFNYTSLLNFNNQKETLNKFQLSSKTYIAINFYGKKSFGMWDDYLWIIDKINMPVVLIGQKQPHIKIKQAIDLINKTSLEDVSVIIKNCYLLISVDGGIMHIAFAQNIPVIGLFAIINSKLLRPINDNYPYFKAFDKDRNKINKEDVLKEISSFQPHRKITIN